MRARASRHSDLALALARSLSCSTTFSPTVQTFPARPTARNPRPSSDFAVVPFPSAHVPVATPARECAPGTRDARRQGLILLSGPARAGKLRVLSAWTPALCSPLNGVTADWHPALTASLGLLNQMPRWYWWTGSVAGFLSASLIGVVCTTGAGATLGATLKVSTLNRPTNVWAACPDPLVSRSPWYHDMPNGASGTWITKRSKSVFAGRPSATTRILSTGPLGVTVTVARARGRQPMAWAFADRTMWNEIGFGPAALAGPATLAAAPVSPRPTAPARAPRRTVVVRFMRKVSSLSRTACPSGEATVPSPRLGRRVVARGAAWCCRRMR